MKFCYCICYIERKYYKDINKDLKKRGFKHVKAIIPEIRILKKSIKNRTFYEEVPVLFNYGFIKMPVDMAFSRTFLIKLRKAIPGIRNWLKSTETMFARKKRRRIDNTEDFDDFSKVAICTREEVRRFKRIAKNNDKYSLDQILNIQEGDYVQLKIYPYEGVGAKIISLDYEADSVTLELYPLMGKFTIRIPLDHVIYSVYKDYDPDTFIRPELNTSKLTSEGLEQTYNNKQL